MSRPAVNGYPRNGTLDSNSRSLGTPQPNQRTESPASKPAPTSTSAMSRAERFEDEKRRIIDSCFTKHDPNGQVAESYITHIRILEDAQHPSAPAPPESPESNKKPRLIIIAVRSTGRVRMHKARENNNGSFSIGKTWNMEELSAIESFSNSSMPPQTEKEAQHRAWAGNTGFTVTITKPYYWQAGTPKEKDFFIASAVKIYRKYTKGQLPDLRGFDEREKIQILGGMPPATAPPTGQLPRQPSESPAPAPPQPPFVQREQSRDGSRYRQSPGPPPSITDVRPGSGPSSRRPSERVEPPGRFAGNGPRPAASTEQMRGASREPVPPELRPGTSPNQNSSRSPSFATTQRSAGQPSQPPLSPAFLASGTAPAPLKPQSPQRQQYLQQPIDGASEDRSPSPANSSSGANLFQQARDRYMNYQPGGAPSTPKPVQGPPIEQRKDLAPVQNGQNGGVRSPLDQDFNIPRSESSTGLDLGDTASAGGPTSYRRPEAIPVAVSPIMREPTSPPTPQRSKRRPKISESDSQNSVDLRPAPLSPPRITTEKRVEAAPKETATLNAEEPAGVSPQEIEEKPGRIYPIPHTLNPMQLQPTSADVSPVETPTEEVDQGALYRPGLGPMFKKKAIADRFKKAATAANSFKPRPGGAAERILQAKAERDGEPDGITGVVPRPAPRHKQEDVPPATPVDDVADQAIETTDREPPQPPTVEISAPPALLKQEPPAAKEARRSVELFDDSAQHPPTTPDVPPEDEEERPDQRQIRQPQVKIKRRSAQQEKYLAALGVDRTLLEGKGLEFELMLSEFGWNDEILRPKQLAVLESDIRREHGRVEAGSWLSHTDEAREERVAHVEGLLDKAIAECDELEGLLTLYHVELSSLNDDIAFIEAQSQGLQVQSANQKLLQTELQSLVDTMSLDRRVLEPLRFGDLSDAHGLAEVEKSLVRLYQAMLTMDPSMGKNQHSRPRSRGGVGENETSNMAALQEKKVTYDRETSEFCKRLVQFLDTRFTASMSGAKGRVLRVPGGSGLAKINTEAFAEIRNGLWMYSPLVLFTKEVNFSAWQTIIRMYHARASKLYGDAFQENLSNWRRAARASSGDEADLLFTALEKEDPTSGGLTSTARKLTVKRSQTLAKTLRNASGIGADKHSVPELKQPGAMMRAQAFAGAMDEMAPLMSREQNFFVDFFHANSMETEDFLDAVEASWPAARRGTNLQERKPTDPDRGVAQLVSATMGEIFTSFGRELEKLLAWAISEDPLQGVGVMASLSRHAFYLQDSSQEYLLHLVRELADKLQTRFSKFVDEQIRAIEDTKVKIKKRKGVIAFMKIFPHFSAAVENTFASVAKDDYDGPAECVLEVRKLVDEAYEKLNRAMFDSLKVIAKESPVAGVPSSGKQAPAGDDPEDKEMLNYHILLIENMNHYIEEVDDGGRPGVLSEWRARAQMERAEALDAYVSRVIRRPLGKLLDFLESAESILATSHNPSAVSSRPTYSRKALRTILAQHDAKELRRGIDTLRKRIEKHFGDADEEALSRNLVGYVGRECERVYERVLERAEGLVKEVYPPVEGEKDVVIDFARSDVQAGFRRGA